VEFMKSDLSEKVEEILTSVYEAKERNTVSFLEDSVANSMEGVMEIRESLLDRIKDIRKGDIKICTDQNIKQEKVLSEFRREIMNILLKLVSHDDDKIDLMKSISKDLLRFKTLVSQEIMRMLMLPQNNVSVPTSDGDNTECEVLTQLTSVMENLVACAEGEENNNEDENTGEANACKEPSMYSMDLITATDTIDSEIGNLYNKLITAIEDDRRQEYFQKLDFYKQLRNTINDVITKLVTEDDDSKLKKVVTRNVKRIESELKSKLNLCESKFGKGGCESCAAVVIYDSIAQMNDFKAFFENSDDDNEKKDFVRSNMIRFINNNDEVTRDLLVDQAKSGDIDECGTDKLDVYKKIKAPMWMLVNSTIFSEMSEVDIMVTAMIEQLEMMLTNYCGEEGTTRKLRTEGPNCDWEEHEQTKEYLDKVDDIIQNALFKATDDSDQMTALLGFVDIQGMLDKRVKKLFEEELICPEEVTVLKQQYMGQLNKCMAQFMNRDLKFSEMSRRERITCTKGLRDTMEDRMAKLLQRELEKNLNEIQGESSGGGYS